MGSWRVWSSGVRQWLRNHRTGDWKVSSERPIVGLALGGGFARGLAHIGVLRILEQNHIPIHMLAGTSVGSIIAGAYASGMPIDEMAEVARSVRFSHFARWTVSRMGLASNARMEKFLRRFLKKKNFEELNIPLAVNATDIGTGTEVVYRSGGLIDPIRASCAYPGLFLPVKIGERTLIDGGFSCAVPVTALAEMGATHIIAVHLVCSPFPSPIPTNVFQMIAQCFSLLQTRAGTEWRDRARSIIEPAVAGHAWDAFEAAPKLIAAGEQAAAAALSKIQSWLEPRVQADSALAYSSR